MTLSGNPVWNAVYSVQVSVGGNHQKLSLAIDTGSSDLWIATKGCSTSECSNSHTTLYDSSTSVPEGQSTSLGFLLGQVAGPVVSDSITIGPYTIDNQGLVAANTVTSENLSQDFVGLLGLGPPASSNIAPLFSSPSGGDTVQQNLFGLNNNAPTHHFIGITLERSQPNVVPSLLTIGTHPQDSIPDFDESKIGFVDVLGSSGGATYWRTNALSITAWIDGKPKAVPLGHSETVPSSTFPVAILDTGGSPILATRTIANAIYGVFNITPASDGNYYLPCTQPLNLTIGLGNLPPIPIHPLDLTSLPQTLKAGANTNTCMGLIQGYDNLDDLQGRGDIVLGVTFLRNVYMVLSSQSSTPQLGLYPLTNATQALDEFHRVRVLGDSLGPNDSNPLSSKSSTGPQKKLNVGTIALIGILGFFVLCAIIFGIRWWYVRRRYKRVDPGPIQIDGESQREGDETLQQEVPFLGAGEKQIRPPSATYNTGRTDFTHVDELGLLSKQDMLTPHSRSPSFMSTPGERESDYFSDWQDRTLNGPGLGDGSLRTPSPLVTADQSPRMRDPIRGELSPNLIHLDEEFGMTGISSRNSVVSMGSGVGRPMSRSPLRNDGSTNSPPRTPPKITREVGSRFEADLGDSLFDGLIPGPNIQLRDLVRGRGSMADSIRMSTVSSLGVPNQGEDRRSGYLGDARMSSYQGSHDRRSQASDSPLL
ncbi:hypothetical protein M422DRAFT_39681 [Sphaerobolus stellatus SS14]|uniref:Unplaced genomic scaffold SPHSTscaffold_656, whole genome shotgun sequence n=1 Tax=Sphaerobolus stellatus (strain SS14) TaxID=990650 RepID=A0A0C9UDS8_SPHS4|nr:hypothetical protein M422DRAFT_39681 [Sphaerobolus stellatus SS14]